MKKRLSPALVLILIILPVVITDITGIKGWKTNINSDGYGYYAYLPCVFIYHHLDFKKVQSEEMKARDNLGKDEVSYPFVSLPGNDNVLYDKYFTGTSIMILPFFLLAYLLSYLIGLDLGGYSVLFEESVLVAALFYLIVGLIFLRKLMLLYKVSGLWVYTSLMVVLYGTNLFYYVTTESSLSHVYSFGLCSLLLYYCKKILTSVNLKSIAVIAFLMGLLIIIRPTNVLTLATVPFLAGNLKSLFTFFKEIFQSKIIFIALVILLSVISIQLFTWHAETGSWFIWSYPGEGFTFGHPHITDILFSYRKGWFVYTPVMLTIIATSLFKYIKQGRYYSAFCILLFVSLITYFCSCWQPWWYGGSFGMRPFIDFYPFFTLLLSLFLSSVTSIYSVISVITLTLCMAVSIVQTIQYKKFIFSFDKMNEYRYWEVFLKTNSKYGWLYENPSSKLSLFNQPCFQNDFEHDSTNGALIMTPAHSGKYSLALKPSPFQLFSVKTSLLPQLNNIWLYERVWVYSENALDTGELEIEVKDSTGKVIYTHNDKFENSMGGPDEWEKVELIEELPALSFKDSIIVSSSSSTGNVFIDDVSIQFGLRN